jgi:lipoyl(octanoyl) transferase
MKPRIHCSSSSHNALPSRGEGRKFARLHPRGEVDPPAVVRASSSLLSSPSSSLRKRVVVYDLHDTVVPYERAWAWQRALVDKVITEASCTGTLPPKANVGYAILLQHDPVYTLGEGSTTDNLKFDMDAPPHPIHRIERGGEVTFHGPGQLVLYPILNLKMLKTDLHWYLRQLEEVIIHSMETVSGIKAGRIDGLTGVWIDNRKVAAIGIRATKWVTYHGIALNVVTDLAPFEHIVPCGIKDEDKEVTSIARELGGEDGFLMTEYSEGLMEGLTELFGLDVVQMDGYAALEALEALEALG